MPQNSSQPKKKKHFCLYVAAVGFALFTGCASGPKYSDVKNAGSLTPRDGHGMILIYRTPGMVGAAYKPYVYANDCVLGKISRGGFYSYEATPGPINLAHSEKLGEATAKTKSQATIGGAVAGGIGAGPIGMVLGAALGAPLDNAARRKHGLDINVLPNQVHYIVFSGKLKEDINGGKDIESCHWLNPAIR